MNRIDLKPYLIRLVIVSIVSLALVFLVSEIAFLVQKDKEINRPPETITLVIPEGTSARIAAGEAPPDIPMEMTFILGDVLVVENQDSVTHRLGPLYIPSGSKGSLPMGEADNFSLNCSFQKTNYLGLDVREPTTVWTRFLAMLTAGPPTIIFLFLNSLLAFPIKKKDEEPGKPVEENEQAD